MTSLLMFLNGRNVLYRNIIISKYLYCYCFMCRHNIDYCHMSIFMGMNLNLTPNSSNNITGPGIWIVLQLRPHFWRRGETIYKDQRRWRRRFMSQGGRGQIWTSFALHSQNWPPTDFCVYMSFYEWTCLMCVKRVSCVLINLLFFRG